MTTTGRPAGDRAEGVVQVVILLAVAGMAGAASFTHVHDWTMHNSPAHTGDWFGWANAMVSELIPLAAGLEVRRRRRKHLPVGAYPIALILGAVALSLAGQFAEAKPGPSGWLISAVPALGFLALVKLVLSRPTSSPDSVPTVPASASVRDERTDTGPVPDRQAVAVPAPAPLVPVSVPTVPVSVPTVPDGYPAPPLDPALIAAARTAAADHERGHGRVITRDALRAALKVSNATASDLLRTLRTEPATPPAVPANGVRPDLAKVPE
ncbi:hypothetical protein [Planosporangium mesophilum]|uniref:DUF2637 domain-containing protein n=1 Tax=Planosporangium mesophilum TaxID=689768 RepID=A0A8J3TFI7_9ACTN|nr:hypothetical protein [Planosporangium mesophilum]GII25344.1 hypothetical protein Pme01_49410 [Planosporangium mesophilum]